MRHGPANVFPGIKRVCTSEVGGGKVGSRGYTHICFVQQLLCLYPFPHRSHLSSPITRFPSPLIRWEPSLARRLRCFVLMGLPRGASSTVAFSSFDVGECLRPVA